MKCNNCGYKKEEARSCGRCGADLQKSAFSVSNDILEKMDSKRKSKRAGGYSNEQSRTRIKHDVYGTWKGIL